MSNLHLAKSSISSASTSAPASAPADVDWHARATALTIDGRLFIEGQRRAAHDEQTMACHSPIDGRWLTDVARGQAADIGAAVQSGRHAFNEFAKSGFASQHSIVGPPDRRTGGNKCAIG